MAEKLLDAEAREDNKIVAGWLLYYNERCQWYERRREEILQSCGPCLSEVLPGRGNAVSDPTGRKVDRLASLEETEKWLAFVEEVERRLPWKMQILLRLKRVYRIGTRGRPVRWRIALELSEEISRKIGKDYSVGPEMVDRWWQRILDYAARLAAKRGLL